MVLVVIVVYGYWCLYGSGLMVLGDLVWVWWVCWFVGVMYIDVICYYGLGTLLVFCLCVWFVCVLFWCYVCFGFVGFDCLFFVVYCGCFVVGGWCGLVVLYVKCWLCILVQILHIYYDLLCLVV